MVLRAGGANTAAQAALANLCGAYWYPLYAFVRRQGHDAQDLTQEFFARLLEGGGVGGVARERGRFRTWLLAAMEHFLINERRRASAQKRGGGAALVSMDDEAEARYVQQPVDPVTAEKLFDRRWPLTLLDRVLARLGMELAESGKTAQFEAQKFCLSGEKRAYAEAALTLGITEGAVKRLRERYHALTTFATDADGELVVGYDTAGFAGARFIDGVMLWRACVAWSWIPLGIIAFSLLTPLTGWRAAIVIVAPPILGAIVSSAARPGRSLQDHVAGAWLVPR
jgi:DNA-directed RNA polymerase specialized sigma24 family protein